MDPLIIQSNLATKSLMRCKAGWKELESNSMNHSFFALELIRTVQPINLLLSATGTKKFHKD